MHSSGRGAVVIFWLSMTACLCQAKEFQGSLYFFILQKRGKNIVFLLLNAGIIICIQMR